MKITERGGRRSESHFVRVSTLADSFHIASSSLQSLASELGIQISRINGQGSTINTSDIRVLRERIDQLRLEKQSFGGEIDLPSRAVQEPIAAESSSEVVLFDRRRDLAEKAEVSDNYLSQGDIISKLGLTQRKINSLVRAGVLHPFFSKEEVEHLQKEANVKRSIPEGYINLATALTNLNISSPTFNKLRQKHSIAHVQIGHGNYYSGEDIQRLKEAREAERHNRKVKPEKAPSTIPEGYIDIETVLKNLNISLATFYKLGQDDVITRLRVGRLYYYSAEDVQMARHNIELKKQNRTIKSEKPAPPDGYIDLDTVATKLGIKKTSVYPYIKNALVDKIKLGRKVFVREEEIDHIVSERQEKIKKVVTSSKEHPTIPLGFINLAEALTLLGISQPSFSKILRSNSLARTRVGHAYYYSREEVQSLKNSREVERQNGRARPERVSPAIPEGYIDIDTVARKLGIKKPSAYPLIAHAPLDMRKTGRRVYISEADIDRLAAERRSRKEKKAAVKEEKVIPEGYENLTTVLGRLGISDVTFNNLRLRHTVSRIRVGRSYYYSGEDIQRLKEAREAEKGNRRTETLIEKSVDNLGPKKYVDVAIAAQRLGMKKRSIYSFLKRTPLDTKEVGGIIFINEADIDRVIVERKSENAERVGPSSTQQKSIPEGYISAKAALEFLSVKPSTFDNWRKKNSVTVLKIGHYNYFLREDIEKIGRDRLTSKSRKKSTAIRLNTHEGEDPSMDSFALFLKDMRSHEIKTPREQLHLGVKIFSGKLGLIGLDLLIASGLLNSEQLSAVEHLRSDPAVNFIRKRTDSDLKEAGREIKGKTLVDLYDLYKKNIERKINIMRDTQAPETVNDLLAKTMNRVINGKDALHMLVETNLRLGLRPSGRYASFSDVGMNKGELMSYVAEGLMTAAVKYDFRLGFNFSTYAMNWIKQSLIRGILNDGSLIRIPVHEGENVRKIERRSESGDGDTLTASEMSKVKRVRRVRSVSSLDKPIGNDPEGKSYLGDFIPDDNVSLVEGVEGNILEEEVVTSLDILGGREALVIKMRYGLGGYNSQTLEEIGAHFGVTRERIRQIEASAMRKLSNDPKLKEWK